MVARKALILSRNNEKKFESRQMIAVLKQNIAEKMQIWSKDCGRKQILLKDCDKIGIFS